MSLDLLHFHVALGFLLAHVPLDLLLAHVPLLWTSCLHMYQLTLLPMVSLTLLAHVSP